MDHVDKTSKFSSETKLYTLTSNEQETTIEFGGLRGIPLVYDVENFF